MIVIADTTPFNYLVQMGRVEMMRVLYGEIYIPSQVWAELRDPGTPTEVRRWAAELPEWIRISNDTTTDDPELLALDAGECAAIALALHLNAGLLLLDERRGRAVAERRGRAVAERKGLPVSGTLGVLRDGANRGLLDFEVAIVELMELGFRASAAVIDEARGELN